MPSFPETNTSNDGESPADAVAVVDFDNDGEWIAESAEGPAIHVPDEIKGIIVTEYRIEWLDVSDPLINFYSKNHMVSTVKFANVMCIGEVNYLSARLSMQVGERRPAPKVAEGFLCGLDYRPGTYTVTLLKFSEVTDRTAHHLTYKLRQGTTIGKLIDMITGQNMHHFLFLPYTVERRWKGCGDHVLHCWAVFVRSGIIIDDNAEERPGLPLSEAMTFTYIMDGRSTHQLIGRGMWLSYNPVQDEHTPETVFSDEHPSYLIPLV